MMSKANLFSFSFFLLSVLFLLLTLSCLSSTQSETIVLDSDSLDYKNPLLEEESIKEKTKDDLPSAESQKESVAGVDIEETPFGEEPKDLPLPPSGNSPQSGSTGQTAKKPAAKPPKNQLTNNKTTKKNPGSNGSNAYTENVTEAKATSPSSATPESSVTEKKHDVIAEVRGDGGSPFAIDLAGKGWSYKHNKKEKRPVNYIGKESTLKGTRFRFSLPKEGSYLFTFVQQDHSTGRSKAYDVRIIIGSGDFQSPEIAETPQKPEISPKEEIERAIAQRNYRELDRLLNLYINHPSIPAGLLNEAYKALKQSGNYQRMQLLLLYRLEKQGGENLLGLAYYYYEMAQIYEKPGRFKDIKKAYKLYKKVYDNYPISPYSGKSKKRMDYLERHFLKVY